jgi:ABC-type phosphate transport system substrate-binding protein
MLKRLLVFLIGFSLMTFASAQGQVELYVIVNANNSLDSLSADQLERLFLLKTKRFENGESAEPVNQSEGSKARELFNEKVLQRNEQQLKYYWSRKMFSGSDKPPPIAVSNSDTETFVSEHPGGVGYLTRQPQSDQVKVVLTVKRQEGGR